MLPVLDLPARLTVFSRATMMTIGASQETVPFPVMLETFSVGHQLV